MMNLLHVAGIPRWRDSALPVPAGGRSRLRDVEATFAPEPSPEEREAILAALAAERVPDASRWVETALREGVGLDEGEA
jgi:hypothetical protein